mgnify:CR=1 FL=1
MKVWSWRHAIQQAELNSTTKLVLLNLSIYMNEIGEGCYPSTARQAKDTGLSERSICTHLDKAEKAGFIAVKKHGFGGQKWSRNEYYATYPKGTESGAEALNVFHKGTEPDDIKALNEVQSNSSVNNTSLEHTSISPQTPQRGIAETGQQKGYSKDFEEFWQIYPNQRKGNKMKAYKCWCNALARASPEEIMAGCDAYRRSQQVADGYARNCTTWLNNDGWTENFNIEAKKGTTNDKGARVRDTIQRWIEE